MNEYDYINKSDQLLRNSIWKVYGKKCFYCGVMLNMNQLEIDHIIPEESEELSENYEKEEVLKYIEDITKAGFIKDCIRNYLPICSHCNKQKSNRYFTAANLRYFHEQTRRKSNEVIKEYEKNLYKKPKYSKCKKNDEYIRELEKEKEFNVDKVVLDGWKQSYYVLVLYSKLFYPLKVRLNYLDYTSFKADYLI